ncbi:antibiotic biosynthesis monooxygenase family protein [Halioxenophilus sp. WMMB6]|uniref:antibiotic biosynthesis monooxygenase family protein n=1 Tax=Halioxenophilus sp. WMMB6 TaxID=3073815 RepID=UPI00295E6C9E|nr:antibiotic biosynthesis monooxygenase [Halioxenophilus sp. WMMB6]
MFIAVYEFDVTQGKEDDFRHYWRMVTQAIYNECGSLGSRLHKTNKPNSYVGYAQWPSRKAWNDNNLTSAESRIALAKMRECLASSKTVYEMDVTDDYLQPNAHSR